jgi:hypothetical protein
VNEINSSLKSKLLQRFKGQLSLSLSLSLSLFFAISCLQISSIMT